MLLLLQILTELYSRVKGARGRWRGAVLGALYGLVECVSSKILLSVARVVLAVSLYSLSCLHFLAMLARTASNENKSLFIFLLPVAAGDRKQLDGGL